MKLHITFLLCLASITPHIRSTMPADLNEQPVIESKDSKKTYYIVGTCGIAVLIGSLFLQRAGFLSKDRVVQRWDSIFKKTSSPERDNAANINETAELQDFEDRKPDTNSTSDSDSDNDSDDENNNNQNTFHVERQASLQARDAHNARLRQEVNEQAARLPQEKADIQATHNAKMAILQQKYLQREMDHNHFLQRHTPYSPNQSNNNNNNNAELSKTISAHQSNKDNNIQCKPEIQVLLDRTKEQTRRVLALSGYTEEDQNAPIGPSGLPTHAPSEPLLPLEELLARTRRLVDRARRNPRPSGPVGPSSPPKPKAKSKSF